jgi:hypothetical protein
MTTIGPGNKLPTVVDADVADSTKDADATTQTAQPQTAGAIADGFEVKPSHEQKHIDHLTKLIAKDQEAVKQATQDRDDAQKAYDSAKPSTLGNIGRALFMDRGAQSRTEGEADRAKTDLDAKQNTLNDLQARLEKHQEELADLTD